MSSDYGVTLVLRTVLVWVSRANASLIIVSNILGEQFLEE